MRYTLDAKVGHQQFSACGRENFFECVLDLDLRFREAFAIDVRAVSEQRQHARTAELSEAVDVEVLPVDRRLIDLEVAGMHDRPGRSVKRERQAVGHAVGHAEEFDFTVSNAHTLPGLDRHKAIAGIDAVLFELRPHERQSQRTAVDGAIDQRPVIGNAADVILVSVRQHECRRAWLALLQVRQVRNQ